MTSKTWPDFGPDVVLVRQQMTLHPPDEGSVVVEHDGERITAVAWTQNGERRSVSTSIVAVRKGAKHES